MKSWMHWKYALGKAAEKDALFSELFSITQGEKEALIKFEIYLLQGPANH